MYRLKTQYGSLLFLVPLLSMLTACASVQVWAPKTGQVLEEGTNKPIANAIVLARWKGSGGRVDTRTSCYHVETTTTDENGNFVIPEWNESPERKLLGDKYIDITVYKAGYQDSQLNYKAKTYREGIYYLDNDERSREERLEYLLHSLPGCDARDGTQKNLFSTYKARFGESKRIAITHKDKKIVSSLRYHSARVMYEGENTLTNNELEAFIQRNLKEQLQ